MTEPEMIERRYTAARLERRLALYSPCETYRYALQIHFTAPAGRPLLPIIGLNPSTATELEDDNTVRREKDFARRWGFGGIMKLNLAAFRSTDPRGMLAAIDPFGPANTPEWLARMACETLGVCFVPRLAAGAVERVRAALANAGPGTLQELGPCCERDTDGDGNCDRHSAPGVLRIDEPRRSLFVLACWGAPGGHARLAAQATAVREALGRHLWAFGLTGNGQPKHPLYLAADATPRPLAELTA